MALKDLHFFLRNYDVFQTTLRTNFSLFTLLKKKNVKNVKIPNFPQFQVNVCVWTSQRCLQ